MRRRYTVAWSRAGQPDDILVCKGLTATVAFARLMAALRASGGSITVHSITPEHRALHPGQRTRR